eukprot:19128-Heterococcus_DN1.PRE.1
MCCDQDVPRGCERVHGACVGLAVVGLAVHGTAAVGLAVVGFAVHGAAVAVRGNNRTRRVATQGSVAHQTALVCVNSYCSLKSTDQTPVNADLTRRRRKLVTINLMQSRYALDGVEYSLGAAVVGLAVVGLAVHGAAVVGFGVVGAAVQGAAVVGFAVVGAAVEGAAVGLAV